jgi:hypothetical protein
MKRRAVNLAFPRTHPRLLPARAEPIFLAAIARASGSRAWLRGNGGCGRFLGCRRRGANCSCVALLGGGAGNQLTLACTPWAWLGQKMPTRRTL